MEIGGFVTDGRHLFEVIEIRTKPGRKEQRNAGLMGGTTAGTPDEHFYVLQNARTGYVWEEIDEKEFAEFKEVVPDVEYAVSLMHATLDRWAERRPAWMD